MLRKTFALASLATLSLVGCADQGVTFKTEQGWEATVPAHTMDRCASDDGTGAPCVWVADEQEDQDGSSFVVLESYDGPFAQISHNEARKLSK